MGNYERTRMRDAGTLPSVSRVVACFLGAIVALSACRAYDRDTYQSLLDAPQTDAVDPRADRAPTDAADVQTDVPADNSDGGSDAGCDPYRVPTRPPGLSDADGGMRVLTFGLRRLNLGFASPELWGQRGFDRDGLCTDPSQPNPEVPCRPRGSNAPPDGLRGRDNALASNIGPLISTSWDESVVSRSIERGNQSVAIRLTFYGGADDAQVRFEWLPLINGHARAGGPPVFDGHDVWSINAAIAYEPGSPGIAAIHTDTAFVSGGVLVAQPPSRAPLRFASGSGHIRLTLSQGRFVGPIDPAGNWLGPLEFSGIWPLSDAFSDVTLLGYCPPPPAENATTWNFVQRTLETAADLLSTLEVSPGVQCDSISVAFQTEWVPIELGPDMMGPPVQENPCTTAPDGGTMMGTLDAGADARSDSATDAAWFDVTEDVRSDSSPDGARDAAMDGQSDSSVGPCCGG